METGYLAFKMDQRPDERPDKEPTPVQPKQPDPVPPQEPQPVTPPLEPSEPTEIPPIITPSNSIGVLSLLIESPVTYKVEQGGVMLRNQISREAEKANYSDGPAYQAAIPHNPHRKLSPKRAVRVHVSKRVKKGPLESKG